MERAISQKHTPSRSESKLPVVVGPKVWPTGTTENTQRGVLRFFFEKELYRSVVINDFARENVYEVGCGQEGLIPKF